MGTVPTAVIVKLPEDCVPGTILAPAKASYSSDDVVESGEICIVEEDVMEAFEIV